MLESDSRHRRVALMSAQFSAAGACKCSPVLCSEQASEAPVVAQGNGEPDSRVDWGHAGLALSSHISPRGGWQCGAILTGEATEM